MIALLQILLPGENTYNKSIFLMGLSDAYLHG